MLTNDFELTVPDLYFKFSETLKKNTMKFKAFSSFSLHFTFCFRYKLQEKQEQHQKLKNYATDIFGIQFVVRKQVEFFHFIILAMQKKTVDITQSNFMITRENHF